MQVAGSGYPVEIVAKDKLGDFHSPNLAINVLDVSDYFTKHREFSDEKCGSCYSSKGVRKCLPDL